MSKVYSFEDCQPVIKEAFKKAIDFFIQAELELNNRGGTLWYYDS